MRLHQAPDTVCHNLTTARNSTRAQGHNSTDYNKWFSTDKAYVIKPRTEYEPWFVIDRLANPFYDSAFRGYGWNKVTHVANVLHQK